VQVCDTTEPWTAAPGYWVHRLLKALTPDTMVPSPRMRAVRPGPEKQRRRAPVGADDRRGPDATPRRPGAPRRRYRLV